MMENVYVVENSVKAKDKIDQLTLQGFTKDEIYVVAHEEDRTEQLSDNLHVNEVGMQEEGVFDKIANVFRSEETSFVPNLKILVYLKQKLIVMRKSLIKVIL